MNRLLLVWNIILSVILLGAVVSGCSSIDPEFAALQGQVKRNTQAIDTLVKAANDNRQLVTNQTQQFLTVQITLENEIAQLDASLKQWVQQWVQQYLASALTQ
ncbi:MAG: hypothetical protein ABID87_08045 [Chloroflexota bacterium]